MIHSAQATWNNMVEVEATSNVSGPFFFPTCNALVFHMVPTFEGDGMWQRTKGSETGRRGEGEERLAQEPWRAEYMGL